MNHIIAASERAEVGSFRARDQAAKYCLATSRSSRVARAFPFGVRNIWTSLLSIGSRRDSIRA